MSEDLFPRRTYSDVPSINEDDEILPTEASKLPQSAKSRRQQIANFLRKSLERKRTSEQQTEVLDPVTAAGQVSQLNPVGMAAQYAMPYMAPVLDPLKSATLGGLGMAAAGWGALGAGAANKLGANINTNMESMVNALQPKPTTPEGAATTTAVGQLMRDLKVPDFSPTGRLSPRPLLSPQDLHVLGARGINFGRELGDIPRDYTAAQSGQTRINPLGSPTLGAKLSNALSDYPETGFRPAFAGVGDVIDVKGAPQTLQPLNLGQNTYATDMRRRGLLGLSGLKQQGESDNLPAVVTPTQPTPEQSTAPASLIEDLTQKALEQPQSRRDFLGQIGKTVASQALQTAMPEVIKQALPKIAAPKVEAIDETKAARAIAGYLTTVFENPDVAKIMYKAMRDDASENVDYDPNSRYGMELLWQNVFDATDEQRKNLLQNQEQFEKMAGIDVDSIAKETGIPATTVRKIMGESTKPIELFENAGRIRFGLSSILDDGQSKEARDSTTFNDLYADNKLFNATAKKLVKKHGVDADAEDIFDDFLNELQERWKAMERGDTLYDTKKGVRKYHEHKDRSLLRREFDKQIVDDYILDDVWEQALMDDNGESYYTDKIYDALEKQGWKNRPERHKYEGDYDENMYDSDEYDE